MTRTYWRVAPAFWGDEKVVAWNEDSRLLALYLLTCEHRTLEGLFRLPMGYIMSDLGWSAERLAEPFAELLRDGFIEYDATVRVILIANALDYQAPDNPNQVVAALKLLEELPDTPLFAGLYQRAERFCKRLAEGLAERFPERLPEGYAKPPTPTPTPTLPTVDAAAVAGAREDDAPSADEERSSSIGDETPETPPPKAPYLMDDDDPMDALLLELWEVEGWKRKPKQDREDLTRLGAAFPRADLAAAIQQLRAKALDGAVKANPRSALQAFIKQLHLQAPEPRSEPEEDIGPKPITNWAEQAECAKEAAVAARRMAAGGGP